MLQCLAKPGRRASSAFVFRLTDNLSEVGDSLNPRQGTRELHVSYVRLCGSRTSTYGFSCPLCRRDFEEDTSSAPRRT